MPIYEYECSQCGVVEEVIQKFSDRPLSACKHCSGKLTKLMSQSTFHLKGSGWYVTDYADKSGKPSSKESDNKKPKKENSSEAKTKSNSGESESAKSSTSKKEKS
ncbi:zinc ribbon domain-containing protein [Desulfococcaceae bacterium HSG7]|nr:zinc ribbon domain-containing protein [Desulfococcaceae bacterium HSG7]